MEQLYKVQDGALLVYDITRPKTFGVAKKRFKELRRSCVPNIPIILLGNKDDAEDDREVYTEDALTFAEDNKIEFLEVSAQSGHNVTEVRSCFTIIRRLLSF